MGRQRTGSANPGRIAAMEICVTQNRQKAETRQDRISSRSNSLSVLGWNLSHNDLNEQNGEVRRKDRAMAR